MNLSSENKVYGVHLFNMGADLNEELSKKTSVLGLQLWELIAIIMGLFLVVILLVSAFLFTSRKKPRNITEIIPLSRIPPVSKEIKEVKVEQVSSNQFVPREGILLTIHDKASESEADKVLVHLGMGKKKNGENNSSQGSVNLWLKPLAMCAIKIWYDYWDTTLKEPIGC